MTFAQALARIETITNAMKSVHDGFKLKCSFTEERDNLLKEHADSIVQLAKIAAEMRASVDDDTARVDPNDWLFASGHYDKLMNGEEG